MVKRGFTVAILPGASRKQCPVVSSQSGDCGGRSSQKKILSEGMTPCRPLRSHAYLVMFKKDDAAVDGHLDLPLGMEIFHQAKSKAVQSFRTFLVKHADEIIPPSVP
jgi:hypothetical protein